MEVLTVMQAIVQILNDILDENDERLSEMPGSQIDARFGSKLEFLNEDNDNINCDAFSGSVDVLLCSPL